MKIISANCRLNHFQEVFDCGHCQIPFQCTSAVTSNLCYQSTPAELPSLTDKPLHAGIGAAGVGLDYISHQILSPCFLGKGSATLEYTKFRSEMGYLRRENHSQGPDEYHYGIVNSDLQCAEA